MIDEIECWIVEFAENGKKRVKAFDSEDVARKFFAALPTHQRINGHVWEL